MICLSVNWKDRYICHCVFHTAGINHCLKIEAEDFVPRPYQKPLNLEPLPTASLIMFQSSWLMWGPDGFCIDLLALTGCIIKKYDPFFWTPLLKNDTWRFSLVLFESELKRKNGKRKEKLKTGRYSNNNSVGRGIPQGVRDRLSKQFS